MKNKDNNKKKQTR